jgi:hypothetical protein
VVSTLDELLQAVPRMSDRLIAIALGSTPGRVRHRRRQLGLVHPSGTPIEPPAWHAKLRALHAGGATVHDIHAGMGWSETLIRTRLSILGLRANPAKGGADGE